MPGDHGDAGAGGAGTIVAVPAVDKDEAKVLMSISEAREIMIHHARETKNDLLLKQLIQGRQAECKERKDKAQEGFICYDIIARPP